MDSSSLIRRFCGWHRSQSLSVKYHVVVVSLSYKRRWFIIFMDVLSVLNSHHVSRTKIKNLVRQRSNRNNDASQAIKMRSRIHLSST